jgi:hypothetical protein
MTHDLLANVLEQLATKVLKVVVSDVRDATYYAEIHLSRNGTAYVIDSRPSDAIALALRADAPIYVEDKVAAQAISLRRLPAEGEERAEEEGELDPHEFRKFLERVKPDDFRRTVH